MNIIWGFGSPPNAPDMIDAIKKSSDVSYLISQNRRIDSKNIRFIPAARQTLDFFILLIHVLQCIFMIFSMFFPTLQKYFSYNLHYKLFSLNQQ